MTQMAPGDSDEESAVDSTRPGWVITRRLSQSRMLSLGEHSLRIACSFRTKNFSEQLRCVKSLARWQVAQALPWHWQPLSRRAWASAAAAVASAAAWLSRTEPEPEALRVKLIRAAWVTVQTLQSRCRRSGGGEPRVRLAGRAGLACSSIDNQATPTWITVLAKGQRPDPPGRRSRSRCLSYSTPISSGI